MLCYVMLRFVMLCYVMLCYVMLCYVMLCYVMLCYVMLCYVMLCYVMLCYVMLCYVLYCIHADSTRSYLQGILPSFISTINYHFQVPAAAAEVRLDEGDGGADGVGWGGMGWDVSRGRRVCCVRRLLWFHVAV